jgi:hypothetical protein
LHIAETQQQVVVMKLEYVLVVQLRYVMNIEVI